MTRRLSILAWILSAASCWQSGGARRPASPAEVYRLAMGETATSTAGFDVWYSGRGGDGERVTVSLTLRSPKATDQVTLGIGGHARWRDQLFTLVSVGEGPPHRAEIQRRPVREVSGMVPLGTPIALAADETRLIDGGARVGVKTFDRYGDGSPRLELTVGLPGKEETLSVPFTAGQPPAALEWHDYLVSDVKLFDAEGHRPPTVTLVLQRPGAVDKPLVLNEPVTLYRRERARAKQGVAVTFRGVGNVERPPPAGCTSFVDLTLSHGGAETPVMLEKAGDSHKVAIGNRAFVVTLLEPPTGEPPRVRVKIGDRVE